MFKTSRTHRLRWCRQVVGFVRVGFTAALLASCAPAVSELAHGSDQHACASCHPIQANAFASSAHATSAQSPVFTKMLPLVEQAWGLVARRRCIGCHEPQHDPSGVDVSVTCLSCHAAGGNHATRDGMLVVNAREPLQGPFANAVPTTAHASRTSGFVASSELCGTCHEVTGPRLFVEPTFSEHAAAAAPEQSCASCHMPVSSAQAAVGGPEREVRSHRFVGLTPPWYADAPTQAQAAADAEDLLRRALRLEVMRDGLSYTIRVTNIGATHAVPTGVAMLRDIWVDATVSFSDGSSQEHPRLLELGSDLVHNHTDGAVTRVALPTGADEARPRALAAQQARDVRLSVPREISTLMVHLRARAYRPELLDVLDPSLAAGVPELHVATVTVPPG